MDLIIYHEVKPGIPCPDGIAAAWVAKKVYPDAELIGLTYQSKLIPDVSPQDRVIVVDFSFRKELLEFWAEIEAEVTVIDHHKTAIEHLSGLSNKVLAKFDLDECGATLAWKTFFPDKPMPAFLEYVRDRDLWNFQLPETDIVHEAMGRLGRTFELFDLLESMPREELLDYLNPIGEPLVAPKREKVKEIAARHILGEVAGHPNIPHVLLTSDGSEDRYISDVCMALYRQHPESPFSACLSSDRTWSLRSDKHGNNFDVGSLALQNGGGGHRNAAGFKQ
jgi:uncharacterized protein